MQLPQGKENLLEEKSYLVQVEFMKLMDEIIESFATKPQLNLFNYSDFDVDIQRSNQGSHFHLKYLKFFQK